MIFLDARIFISYKKSSVKRLTCILRIMKDGGRNNDDECDEVLKQFSFFLERSLPEDCDVFVQYGDWEIGHINFTLITWLTE